MDLANILMIVSAVVVVVLLWLFWSKRQLRYLHGRIGEEWKLLDESLRKRQSLVPNLVETVRQYASGQEEMLESLIAARMKAAREYNNGEAKIEYEYDLTKWINKVVDLGREYKELSLDTNFLELRKEIDDLENNVEEKSQTYNQMVRRYNAALGQWWFALWARVFGFAAVNIFEFEV